MRKHFISAILAMSLLTCLSAQDSTETHNPVIVTTFQWAPPAFGDTTFKNLNVDSIVKIYVDRGVRPNSMIKNFRILRHAWGADSYKVIFIYEIDKMENLDKAQEKSDDLVNKGFKTEAEKKKFWSLWGKLFDRHEDSIMTDFVKPKM
jgi:hypothetical protein